MAARVTGTSRVLNKLEACIDCGNYYEAHQMYRTLYFRYQGQKRYAELKELLYNGAVKLLRLDQCNSGADLANLLVDVLVQSDTEPCDEQIERLGSLFALLAPHSPERSTFLARALQWSAGKEQPARGHPQLHRLVALALWKEKNYPEARHHFVHSTDGDGCAAMLIEFQMTKGYSCEIDLFIAQTVFQYLCLRNPSTASVVFLAYTRRHPSVHPGPPYYMPLLNFLWCLLLAVETRKLAVFTVLCEHYQPTISRDPTYPQYLDKIGQLFFGLPPPPKPQGMFESDHSLSETVQECLNFGARTNVQSYLRQAWEKHRYFVARTPCQRTIAVVIGNLIQTLLGGLEDDDSGSSSHAGMATGQSTSAEVQPEELD